MPQFPQYDAKTAARLHGSAAAAGGLAAFLAIEHLEVGPGTLHARVAVRDDLLTPFRNLHGGVLAALCDHVLGTVLYPVIPHGAWAATTEFKINYLAAVKSGTLVAESRVVSCGRRSAVVRVEVANGERLVCVAQGTLLISDPPGTRAA